MQDWVYNYVHCSVYIVLYRRTEPWANTVYVPITNHSQYIFKLIH